MFRKKTKKREEIGDPYFWLKKRSEFKRKTILEMKVYSNKVMDKGVEIIH